MPPDLLQLRENYSWVVHDLSSLQAACLALRDAVGMTDPDRGLDVRMEWAGPPSITMSGSDSVVLSASRPDPPTRVTFDYYDADIRIWVTGDLLRSEIGCDLTIPVDQQEKGVAAMESFQKTLQVERYDRQRTGWRRTERQFDCSIQTPQQFFAGVEPLEPLHQGHKEFRGGVQFAQGGRESFDNRLEEWKGSVIERWNDCRSLYWRMDSHIADTEVDYDSRSGILRLTVETVPGREQRFEDTLKAALDGLITPASDLNPAMSGSRCRFLLKGELNGAWMDEVIKAVTTIIPNREHFDGSYRVVNSSDDVSSGDLDAWRTKLAEKWDSLWECRFYASNRKRRMSFFTAFNQGFVDIMIQAPTEAEAKDNLDKLQKELNLEPVSQVPTNQWRTRAEYVLELPNRDVLADCIDKTVGFVFPNRVAQLINATIVYIKETEEQTAPGTLEAFLEGIRRGEPFKEFHLVLEGRKRTGLGIHYLKSTGQLEIKTSKETSEFQEITEYLNSRLGAQPKSLKTNRESPKAESKATSFSDSIWGKAALAVVGGVVGLVLSPTFLGARGEEVKLDITLPVPIKEGDEVKLRGPSFVLEWRTNRKQFFVTKPDTTSLARVRVFRDGQVLKQDRMAKSGESWTLTKGSYTIKVIDPRSNVEDAVRVFAP